MSVTRKTRPLGHVKFGNITTDNDPLNKRSASIVLDSHSNNGVDIAGHGRRSFDVGSIKTMPIRKGSLNVGVTLPDDVCRVSKDFDSVLKPGIYYNTNYQNNDKPVLNSVAEGVTQEFIQSVNAHSNNINDGKTSKEIEDKKIHATKPLPSIKTNKESKEVLNVTENHKYLEESEKKLRKKVKDLEAQINKLKKNLSDKDSQITELSNNIHSVTIELNKYKLLYETEVQNHNASKIEMKKLANDLLIKEKELAEMKENQELMLRKLVADYEAKLIDLETEKDKLIADLQEKIERLKKQIASNFDGKAWERQHQIEELTKEMKRMQDENESQRIQIRRADKKRQEGLKSIKGASGCSQCQNLGLLIGELTATLSTKEDTIQKLTTKYNEYDVNFRKPEQLIKR